MHLPFIILSPLHHHVHVQLKQLPVVLAEQPYVVRAPEEVDCSFHLDHLCGGADNDVAYADWIRNADFAEGGNQCECLSLR